MGVGSWVSKGCPDVMGDGGCYAVEYVLMCMNENVVEAKSPLGNL